jgi:hypothetical protein
MKIETKYDIGHLFYVPRVYKRIKTETMMWDGEEWERNIEYYEPLVKQKEIIRILATREKDSSGHVSYYVVDKGQYRDMSSVYGESKITDYTYETALAIAESYAEENKEYFGN